MAGKRELPELIVHTGYDKLDVPPGISLLSENVLRAADVVVVPLLPRPSSVRMLVQLQEFVAAEGWTDVKLLPFFSMVDRRKSLHHEVIASTRAEVPGAGCPDCAGWRQRLDPIGRRRLGRCHTGRR